MACPQNVGVRQELIAKCGEGQQAKEKGPGSA